METHRAQSSDYAVTFGSTSGQAVLEDLAAAFWVHDTLYRPGIPELDMAFREGQRSVIVQILATVDAAMNNLDEVPETYAR